MHRVRHGILFGIAVVLMVTSPAAEATPGDDVIDTLYERFVSEDGLVDYAGLKSARGELDAAIEVMSAVEQDVLAGWSEADRIAYWINLYNIFTIQVIVDHYPIESSKIKSAVFPTNSIRQIEGAWTGVAVRAPGGEYTLDQIEHEVLRGRFGEPRIHMALVCASAGCPPLRRKAYRGDILDAQLADQTRLFLAQRGNFRIERDRGMVFLSSIFEWFAGDFASYATATAIASGDDPVRGPLAFVAMHVGDSQREYIEKATYKVGYLPYDWTLNDEHR